MDIAQTITDRIIAELEQGTAPWVKPWDENCEAYNPISVGYWMQSASSTNGVNMFKNFRSYRVNYYLNHQTHERFMSVNWISCERDIASIIHAEFGHAAHVRDIVQLEY